MRTRHPGDRRLHAVEHRRRLRLLRVAQTLADIRAPNNGLKLETVVFGARGQERTSQLRSGWNRRAGARRRTDIDLLLMPGLMHNSPHDLVERRATRWARRWS